MPMIVSALIVVALASAGAQPHDARADESKGAAIRVEGKTLVYSGLLDRHGVDALRRQLDAHQEVTAIRIDSSGGDAMAAIEAGKAIRARRLDVVVEGRCNSACANYIFVPAANRTILPGGAVFWHNSCPQNIPPDTKMSDVLAGRHASVAATARPAGEDMAGKTVEDLLADRKATRRLDRRMKGYFRNWAKAHMAFFEDVPVDGRVMCLGDYLQLPGGSGYGYTLSVEDMARFGLCAVQASPTYLRDAQERLARDGKAEIAGAIRLADYPGFRPGDGAGACSMPDPAGQEQP